MALPPRPHFGFISIFNRGDNCAFHLDKSLNLKAWICLKFSRLFQSHVLPGRALPGGGQGRNLTKNSDWARSGCAPHSPPVVPSTSSHISNISKCTNSIISFSPLQPLLEGTEESVWKGADPQPGESTSERSVLGELAPVSSRNNLWWALGPLLVRPPKGTEKYK